MQQKTKLTEKIKLLRKRKHTNQANDELGDENGNENLDENSNTDSNSNSKSNSNGNSNDNSTGNSMDTEPRFRFLAMILGCYSLLW